MFDWLSLLRAHSVEFVTRGPNVRRGQIAVHCPWCGDADPSHHLGISLKGEGWGCWRNQSHRGRSRSRLIEALLRCSGGEARRLSGEEDFASTPTDDDLGTMVARDLEFEALPSRPTSLEFPTEFKEMSLGSSGSLPFWEYLYKRGYSSEEATFIVNEYGLRYSRMGEWSGRLIIPIQGALGVLLTWTGRTIIPGAIPRYKSLASNLSVSSPTECLLGLSVLWSARRTNLLVVCEGPFDALRITALGHDLGVYGTCLFGLNASTTQAFQLASLGHRFLRIGLCLDADADMASLRIQDKLQVVNIPKLRPLVGFKDPGELPSRAGRSIIQSWLS